MKKMTLFVMLAVMALLVGCQSAQQKAELTTCQQEKFDLQGQLEQANATIQQKDQAVEKQKAEIRELNQKALESIRTMMEKQNAKDVEVKNQLKAKQAEAATLQQQVNALQEQLKAAQAAVEAAQAAAQTPEAPAAPAAQ